MMTGFIYWAQPHFIWGVFIVVALTVVFIRNNIIIGRALAGLAHATHRKFMVNGYASWRVVTKTIFMVLALVFLIIALMRPQWGKREQNVVQEGRDLVILLDISRSMRSEDFKPSRLEAAKMKLQTLLARMESERVALILFSGAAFVQCPFTADKAAFKMFLEQVSVEAIASGTTSFDKALLKACELFAPYKERKNKLVLLVTDGEDFSRDLSFIKKQAKSLNIKLLALGIGSPEGAPIPMIDTIGRSIGYEQNTDGSVALSKLNEPLLKKMTQELSGHYVRATPHDGDIDKLISIVSSYEKEKTDDRSLTMFEEHYHYFLLGSAACLALEWIL